LFCKKVVMKIMFYRKIIIRNKEHFYLNRIQ